MGRTVKDQGGDDVATLICGSSKMERSMVNHDRLGSRLRLFGEGRRVHGPGPNLCSIRVRSVAQITMFPIVKPVTEVAVCKVCRIFVV
jgi:hypothetical protein